MRGRGRLPARSQHPPHHARPRRPAPALAAAALACANWSWCAAQEPPTTLPAVTVTGSRLPQPQAPLSQSVLLLTRAQIEARQPADLPQLLRGIASLHVDAPGRAGGFASVYLRGADPNQTLLLIDGVKVGDPTNARGGGIDLGEIDPQTIERIEILPGASSAVYGAQALAGVINIVTRQPERNGATAGAGAGGGGHRSGHLGASASGAGASIHARAAARDEGRTTDDAWSRLRTASLRFEAGGPPGERAVGGWLRLQRRESATYPEDSGGPALAVRRGLEQRTSNAVVGALNAERKLGWGALRLYANAHRQDSDVDSPGVAPGLRDPGGLPASRSSSHYRRHALGVMASFGSGAQAHGLLGAEWEDERGEVATELFFGRQAIPADFALRRRTRSLFGEKSLRLGERLTAHAGVRLDDSQTYGTRWNGQAGLRYLPRWSETSALALNAGTGFRPPSLFALAHPIVGNAQLQPEESRTLELSVASRNERPGMSAPLAYRAAAFRSHYEQLIDFDAGPPPRLVNRSRVVISGYEVSAAARAGDRLAVRASATGLASDLPPDVPALRSRPRFRATAGAEYRWTDRLGTALHASWVSRVGDSSVPTGAVTLPAYLVADATLSYVHAGMRLVLAVDNVFDRQYQQFVGFPARGRRARLAVSVEL